MREPADNDALLQLLAAGGPSGPRRRLLDSHPAPSHALAAGAREWRSHGLDARQCDALRRPDNAVLGGTRAWLEQPGNHLVGWGDPDYPALLARVSSAPLALFVAGDPARLWHPAVAVVGSRMPSAGGRDNAREFAEALARSGLSVASGLAAGIDTAAHEGALVADGLTVAVLGTGPDVAYPRANARLHRCILDAGGVIVSEHPPGTTARREYFPARNRLLAGLSLATLVIEAAARSGALITARLAAECGREVFAVPGSIHNPMARGCHRLIRDGAGLVESAQEVIDAIGPAAEDLAQALRGRLAAPSSGGRVAAEAPATLPPDYQRLWQALGHDPTGMDRLASRTGLTTAELSSMLLLMELEGRVEVALGRYSRKR